MFIAVTLVAVYLAREPAPAPEEAPAAAQPKVESRAPAPSPIAAAAGPRPVTPDAGPVALKGQGSATVVPTPPEHMPNPDLSSGTDENPEILPEKPQTPEWRLEKTMLIADSLGKRVERLERDLREAEARGDKESATSRRMLLERSRMRVEELKREMASLREQVRADGGASLAGSAGGLTP